MPFLFGILIFWLCSCENPKPGIILPEIPPHTLKDPSSITYDGRYIYIADWTGSGILVLDARSQDSEINTLWIKMEDRRPIHVAAIDKNLIAVETDAEDLFLVEFDPGSANNTKNVTRLNYAFERKAGTLSCWDGIYMWFFENNAAFPAVLLDNRNLSSLPSMKIGIRDNAYDDDESLALACGWGSDALLLRHPGGYDAIFNILSTGAQSSRIKLSKDAGHPISLTSIGPGKYAMLAKKENSFELVPINQEQK
ncbi:hypothetical protein ACFL6Y_01495 [Elusimicrobiota bacterium]